MADKLEGGVILSKDNLNKLLGMRDGNNPLVGIAFKFTGRDSVNFDHSVNIEVYAIYKRGEKYYFLPNNKIKPSGGREESRSAQVKTDLNLFKFKYRNLLNTYFPNEGYFCFAFTEIANPSKKFEQDLFVSGTYQVRGSDVAFSFAVDGSATNLPIPIYAAPCPPYWKATVPEDGSISMNSKSDKDAKSEKFVDWQLTALEELKVQFCGATTFVTD